MKITDLLVKQIALPLKQTFKIALGTDYEYVGVVIRIETDEEIVGIGEASPSARITGETTKTVIDVIENKLKPLLIGKSPLDMEKLLDEINYAILYNSSAKCAIDIALHDIISKYAKLPLYKLLGGFKEEIITSITIGIKGIKDTVLEARELVAQGTKVIKIKIGLNPVLDIEKIKSLREEIGYDVKIRVDANQGYEPSDAIQVLRKIEQYEIEFAEQPVAYWDIQGLKQVREHSGIPIMVDESLHSTYDAINLIRENACDIFNIKIMKSGGIREASKIASIAESAGIPCMLGCMVETRIGVGAATHLALALKNIKFADLDGHLFLKEDIVEGGVITEKGVNRVTSKAGIGVNLVKKIF